MHDNTARFKVLAAGRRWGKTRLGVNECLDVAFRGGRAWWIAPSYKLSEVGWRPLRRIGARLGAEVRRVDRQILLPNGGEVTVRSADNPDSLRGEGLDFIVLDECAFISPGAWFEALRPALSDREGRAMFISTPKGRNWFWRLWTQGQVEGGKTSGGKTSGEITQEWQSWRLPTADNPHIPRGEIDAARRSLPERIFRQEYLAEFIDDAGGVFRNVMAAATAVELAQGQEGQEYVFGVDWGKHNDFSVIVVLNSADGRMVHFDRFNQIDYRVQVGRLMALADRFRPITVIAERNSMGEPLVEQLIREGLPVQPFQTTNASKAQIIDALTLAFERGEIEILNEPQLISELQAYEAERLPSGMLRYNAPDGMHDDSVMALALAWHGVSYGLPFVGV